MDDPLRPEKVVGQVWSRIGFLPMEKRVPMDSSLATRDRPLIDEALKRLGRTLQT